MDWREALKKDNIKNFIQGHLNKFLDNTEYMSLELHIKEQVIYRASLCQDCYYNGSCLKCGCKTPDMFYSTNKVDSLGKWKEMLDKEQWNIFKVDNKIDMNSLSNIAEELKKKKQDSMELLAPWEIRQKINDLIEENTDEVKG
jgi:hypothetical protein